MPVVTNEDAHTALDELESMGAGKARAELFAKVRTFLKAAEERKERAMANDEALAALNRISTKQREPGDFAIVRATLEKQTEQLQQAKEALETIAREYIAESSLAGRVASQCLASLQKTPVECRHRNAVDRPKYAIDDPPGHWFCPDCGDTFPLIGDTDQWKPSSQQTP